MNEDERIWMVKDGMATVSQGRKFSGLSRSTLYALMENGELAYVKIGRSRRIPWRALINLAASNLKGGWRVDDQ